MAKEKYLTNADFNAALPKETAELFQIKNMEKRTSTRLVLPKFGIIDFKTMSIKQAEFLVKINAPFIERKSKTKKENV